jgi:hypothetical protein
MEAEGCNPEMERDTPKSCVSWGGADFACRPRRDFLALVERSQ